MNTAVGDAELSDTSIVYVHLPKLPGILTTVTVSHQRSSHSLQRSQADILSVSKVFVFIAVAVKFVTLLVTVYTRNCTKNFGCICTITQYVDR